MCAGVPLNNKYDHTLYFANETDQLTYFNSHVDMSFHAYSYVRKKWSIKVEATFEQARVWSYLFFRNGTGKRYFYFITNVEYVSDVAVELSLELDVMQTYMFDWQLRPCYVDREHAATDAYGANTINEGLDVGDLIVDYSETADLCSNVSICMASTIDLKTFYEDATHQKGDLSTVQKVDNLVNGLAVYAWDITSTDANVPKVGMLNHILKLLTSEGKSDAVFAMWHYPTNLLQRELVFAKNPSEDLTYQLAYRVTGSLPIAKTAFAYPQSIDGYTPKNKKVLQYPYCFLYATNNNGGAAVYRYEHFETHIPSFRIQGNVSPDAVVKLVPTAYKGVAHNYDEALSMSGFPLASWNSDAYKMWLAQNQSQQNASALMSGLKIVGGVAAIIGGVVATAGTAGAGSFLGASGVTGGVGLITSGLTDIGMQQAQRADMDVQPPQARGSMAGSHNMANKIHNFDLHRKTVDAYHAEMIDNCFTMYGYATRKVKTPNISSRPAFNYVKTIGSNIGVKSGRDFCVEDKNAINAIFDRGITFWKNPDVGNYALNNQP